MRKIVLLALLCFVIVLPVFAQAKAEVNGNSTAIDLREAFLSKANEVVISSDSVTFTDASGSNTPITLSKNPRNVSILYASFATLWYEAGGNANSIIGGDSAIEQYETYIGRDITQDHGMHIAATASNAKKWDIERILADRPDLIICSTAMNGYATISNPAKAAGINVIAVDYADFSDYLKWFKVFSALTGHEELWESVALTALDDVVKVLESCPEVESPKVFCMFSTSTGLDANTSNTVIGEMLSQMGATNITDQWGATNSADRIEINLETVFAADPDVILIQCHAGTDIAKTALDNQFGQSPVWNALRAVKNNHVVFLPRDLFHNKPNRRFAEAYQMLAEILYPNK